jgi:HlyD family secretion protein
MQTRRWPALLAVGLIALIVAACGSATPTPEPVAEEATPEALDVGGGVSATGEVIPSEWTTLSFATGGRIDSLPYEVGDQIDAGETVAQLRAAELESAVRQAEAGLAEAEARLAETKAGPSDEEIAAAEQAVSAATARTAAAAAQRDALYTSVTEGELENAQAELYQTIVQRDLAVEQLQDLQDMDPEDCEDYKEWWPDIPDLADEVFVGERLDIVIEQSQVLENTLFQCPLGAYSTVEQYAILSDLAVQASQAYVDELQRGPTANQERLASARVWQASAQAEAAKARLAYLEAQPLDEAVAVAEAEVEMAQAQVEVARSELEQAMIEAPFAGTVTDVMVEQNEFVAPGQPVVELADLSTLLVETTDLNEIDVARIDLGEKAFVTFDALPGIEIEGTVTDIPTRAAEGVGVNFPVQIELGDVPDGLRWGMTAFVEFPAE